MENKENIIYEDDEEEDEIFFGDVSEKEKRKAAKFGKRRTMVFTPGFRDDRKLMRYTMDPARLAALTEEASGSTNSNDDEESATQIQTEDKENVCGASEIKLDDCKDATNGHLENTVFSYDNGNNSNSSGLDISGDLFDSISESIGNEEYAEGLAGTDNEVNQLINMVPKLNLSKEKDEFVKKSDSVTLNNKSEESDAIECTASKNDAKCTNSFQEISEGHENPSRTQPEYMDETPTEIHAKPSDCPASDEDSNVNSEEDNSGNLITNACQPDVTITPKIQLNNIEEAVEKTPTVQLRMRHECTEETPTIGFKKDENMEETPVIGKREENIEETPTTEFKKRENYTEETPDVQFKVPKESIGRTPMVQRPEENIEETPTIQFKKAEESIEETPTVQFKKQEDNADETSIIEFKRPEENIVKTPSTQSRESGLCMVGTPIVQLKKTDVKVSNSIVTPNICKSENIVDDTPTVSFKQVKSEETPSVKLKAVPNTLQYDTPRELEHRISDETPTVCFKNDDVSSVATAPNSTKIGFKRSSTSAFQITPRKADISSSSGVVSPSVIFTETNFSPTLQVTDIKRPSTLPVDRKIKFENSQLSFDIHEREIYAQEGVSEQLLLKPFVPGENEEQYADSGLPSSPTDLPKFYRLGTKWIIHSTYFDK